MGMNERGSRFLNQEHVAAVIRDDSRLDFLLPMVKDLRQIPKNDGKLKIDVVELKKPIQETVEPEKKVKRLNNSQNRASLERKEVSKKRGSEFILTPLLKDSCSFTMDIPNITTADLDEDYD